MVTKVCARCGASFSTGFNRQKYCSKPCKMGHGACEHCGKAFIRKSGSAGRFCSTECWYEHKRRSGANHCPVCSKEFKGNRQTCSQACGIVLRTKQRKSCEYCGGALSLSAKARTRFCSRSCSMHARANHGGAPAHKYKDGTGYYRVKVNGKWIMEHRHVMSQILGRPLEEHERIHHKNGIRSDNRPENLELWTVNHKDPAGIRVIDWVLSQLMQQPEIKAMPKKNQDTIINVARRLAQEEL
jgi:hypothetical protein